MVASTQERRRFAMASLAEDLHAQLQDMTERIGFAAAGAFSDIALDADRALLARRIAISETLNQVASAPMPRDTVRALANAFAAIGDSLRVQVDADRLRRAIHAAASMPSREWIEAHSDALVDDDAEWDEVVGQALDELRATLRAESLAVGLPRVDPLDLGHLVVFIAHLVFIAKPNMAAETKRLIHLALLLAHAITIWLEHQRRA